MLVGGIWPFPADCRLSIQSPLPFPVLDRVRPLPSTRLPDVSWADRLPGNPIGARRGFLTTWFADVPAVTTAPPAGSRRVCAERNVLIGSGRPGMLTCLVLIGGAAGWSARC